MAVWISDELSVTHPHPLCARGVVPLGGFGIGCVTAHRHGSRHSKGEPLLLFISDHLPQSVRVSISLTDLRDLSAKDIGHDEKRPLGVHCGCAA